MTALALRTSGKVNAVSELHRDVTRDMWQSIWPDRRIEDLPVKAITNGVHVPTWLSSEIATVLAVYPNVRAAAAASWRPARCSTTTH